MNILTILVGLCCFVASTVAAPGDCTFDNGLCGYKQDLHDFFDWTQNNGSTPSSLTGPPNDATTGSGHYMYIETSWPRLNNEKAILVSPPLDGAQNCLEFYYYMKGFHIKALNVYTQETAGSRKLQWSLSGDQNSTSWSKATIKLPSQRQNIKVAFEGVSGASFMGDIAIDDVRVYYNHPQCETFPPEAIPKTPSRPLDCGKKPGETRIVGGVEAQPGAWPWQAMLMYSRGDGVWKQFCGGTLVSIDWIVTAAHCVETTTPADYESLRIRMGAHYINLTTGVEQDFEIEYIYIHPDYNGYPYSISNDIALIKLKKPAMLNDRTRLACIPDYTVNFPTGTDCFITGWGTLNFTGVSPWKLQEAKVQLISTADCTKNGSYPASKISPTMQCAGIPDSGGVDTCQGDSGGPLVCKNNGKWYLVGVTSWGYGCANPNFPGVYAKVPALKQWLASTIANHCDNVIPCISNI